MAREKDRLHRPSWPRAGRMAIAEAVAQLLSSMCRVKNWEMRRWHPLPGCTRRLHARWFHGRSRHGRERKARGPMGVGHFHVTAGGTWSHGGDRSRASLYPLSGFTSLS